MPLTITIIYSYLLGSIPFGYILVRTFRGQDVRRTGSGNIGATNVSRTSPLLGILTLALDAIKGAAAVWLTQQLFPGKIQLSATAALAAVVGHMFPIWLGFRGGKGVATGLGSFAVIFPKTVLIMIGVFAAIFLAFRYVSLASILTLALFPIFVWGIQPEATPAALAITVAASLLIVIKHHENIARLVSGSEPRFQRKRA